MTIIIEAVTNDEGRAAMRRVRREVFELERGIEFGRLRIPDQPQALHLLARTERGGDPVAALSVVETTGDDRLHESCGLSFAAGARAARYTQLAVLKSYRGMNIPLRLILEAHHLFVVPGRFDHSWLLFDADRAAGSLLCLWLAFVPHLSVFQSEYGLSRSLVRDENDPRSKEAVRQVERYFQRAGPSLPLCGSVIKSKTIF